jgi:hypothetical protein
MALNRPHSLPSGCLLSGVKRKLDSVAARSVDDPVRTCRSFPSLFLVAMHNAPLSLI